MKNMAIYFGIVQGKCNDDLEIVVQWVNIVFHKNCIFTDLHWCKISMKNITICIGIVQGKMQ